MPPLRLFFAFEKKQTRAESSLPARVFLIQIGEKYTGAKPADFFTDDKGAEAPFFAYFFLPSLSGSAT